MSYRTRPLPRSRYRASRPLVRLRTTGRMSSDPESSWFARYRGSLATSLLSAGAWARSACAARPRSGGKVGTAGGPRAAPGLVNHGRVGHRVNATPAVRSAATNRISGGPRSLAAIAGYRDSCPDALQDLRVHADTLPIHHAESFGLPRSPVPDRQLAEHPCYGLATDSAGMSPTATAALLVLLLAVGAIEACVGAQAATVPAVC